MNNSKVNLRRIAAVLALTALLVLSACGRGANGTIVEGKVNVVTTFYPIYEFASAIGGDDANVINLLPTGVEPHDWTPRGQDIVNTSKAQLFFYNGAGLEGWVPDFLKGLDSDSKVKAVEVSEGVDLITTDEDDGHNHGTTTEHDEDEHAEDEHAGEEHADESTDTKHIDPHTWVSPKSALIMAGNIRDSLVEADPEHKAGYEERYTALADKLERLDKEFTDKLSAVPNKEIVVSHQAFGYLARDYGLDQHAIMGLSPDAEPRAQDMLNLAKLVKEEGIRYIFFEELVSDKLAKTLAGEAGVETLVLNPVEGLTEAQAKTGDDYFSLMQKNLQNLLLALQ
ncbi:zinc ABC transporter substrate-binding protein [Saccharibacillus sp. CPCC 101409]|uniref:metal ABC transporter solute-binding protein, Zn/Mn family n=1 Tax=Saccharibacillus sp. CPCC 101409 TaxID=3058041 RepID=UPI002673EED1|nr:zinc ABC transporter substrate-binding protein [Saccharibacillus sp. CPCC 101409]MDO3409520.1 zinc ABC transporter substrate-binding protein [Saccharibacillus sp. CPCC 101409]